MPRADFYLIAKPRFSAEPLKLVCELVRKAYAAQQPTVILTRDFAQAEALDELLWSFDDDVYIPHQLAGDDEDEQTAVLIVPPGIETPARMLAINLREQIPEQYGDRILEVVSADPAEREGSRIRWREYQRLGLDVAKYDM